MAGVEEEIELNRMIATTTATAIELMMMEVRMMLFRRSRIAFARLSSLEDPASGATPAIGDGLEKRCPCVILDSVKIYNGRAINQNKACYLE